MENTPINKPQVNTNSTPNTSQSSSSSSSSSSNDKTKKIQNGLDPLNIIKAEKEQRHKEEKEKRRMKMFGNLANESLIPSETPLIDQSVAEEAYNEQQIEETKEKDKKEQNNINEFFKVAQQNMNNMKIITNKKREQRCNLILGEKVKEHQMASYKSYDKSLIGILVITNFRLIFRFDNEANYKKMNFHSNYFNYPHFQIEKIVKLQEKEGIFSLPIEVTLKDTRIIKFHIWDKTANRFYNAINEHCFPSDPLNYFTFTLEYKNALFDSNAYHFNGWDLYNPIKEFKRQGVTEVNDLNLRFCDANKDFKLCATYPKFLIVHNEMTDDQLIEASKHRTKNRLPVLSYYYGRNKNKNVKACPCLWRSSQTKSGITGNNKSNMDILLLENITKLCAKLYIFDARPYINALANRVNGGGFENVNHYSNANIIFCEIDHIHAARNSLAKLNQLCLSSKIMDNQKFYSSLESTGWYTFIRLLLKYSNEISLTLQKSYSVLIHCSDGWDRSSQLVCLAQILLDPYFRTIEGFACLIEKDFLSFGHQFGLRNGIYFKEPKECPLSPIFLQFLDCLHQLLIQFPNAFEFNDDLLVFLANNYNSNLYGTFMYNSEKERLERKAKVNSTSVWSDVMMNISKYKNVYYNSSNPIEVLNPNYAPYNLVLWSEYFMQYNIDLENNSFPLSDSEQGVTFQNIREFFDHHKRMDVLEYMNYELKYDHLANLLIDIYKTVKDEEVFGLLDETTKETMIEIVNKQMGEMEVGIGSESENEGDKQLDGSVDEKEPKLNN